MSRSNRTAPARGPARRRIRRYSDDSIRLPRIIERRPARGDIHPLTRKTLTDLLPHVPIEYVNGLDRIELRPRAQPNIGRPYGSYWIDERAIILYSLPRCWHASTLGNSRALLEQYHATIKPSKTGFQISWPARALMSLWFYSFVFTHELGHHFVEQYKRKNRPLRSRRLEELIADLHSKRLIDGLPT